MIKVMLVDDDVPMFKYLHKLIPWNEMGLQITATAQSGAKALQMFQETEPHLVITDIGMPKMDGIELADRLKQMNPDVRIIFLTCHEDFHYAKEAVKLKADDYLIKDELTADSLKQSVEKAVRLIGFMRDRSENISYREEVDRNRDLLKRSFWKQIVAEDYSEVTLSSGRKLGIDWKDLHFMLGLIHIDYSSLLRCYDLKDEQLIYYAIYNIAQELAESLKGVTVFAHEGLELYFVMNYQRNLVVNAHETFRRFAADLQSKAEAYLKVCTYFVNSYEFQGLKEIGNTLGELKLYNSSLYYEKASFHTMPSSHSRSFMNVFDPSGESFKETLLQAYRDKDIDAISDIIDNVAKQTAADQSSPSSLIAQLSQWVRLLEYDSGYDKDHALFHSGLERTVRLQETLQSVKGRIKTILFENSSDELSGIDKHKLQMIDRYIMEHLSENISLVSIANHLYLNPSYFSRYFKKMSGVNFTDYVHHSKMKIALQLLKNREMTIEMIAAKLGYSDRTYFSKVFKKYNGISPVDYKGKYGKL
ncbi:response regulator [Paenibacillus sp. LMG 31458]|uniref:Response regulator n=1 Tax=Paenibacillus phytorum TaxID=2654977 RepID=A0ABX1Y319_9BACL|nr:response regulator [Paenibacillus phytorum]NOU75213.1 response regulator [Paenibacillus phytorum]